MGMGARESALGILIEFQGDPGVRDTQSKDKANPSTDFLVLFWSHFMTRISVRRVSLHQLRLL